MIRIGGFWGYRVSGVLSSGFLGSSGGMGFRVVGCRGLGV